MTRTTLTIAAALSAALLLSTLPARADCIHNGEPMPEGSRVGDFECKDGPVGRGLSGPSLSPRARPCRGRP